MSMTERIALVPGWLVVLAAVALGVVGYTIGWIEVYDHQTEDGSTSQSISGSALTSLAAALMISIWLTAISLYFRISTLRRTFVITLTGLIFSVYLLFVVHYAYLFIAERGFYENFLGINRLTYKLIMDVSVAVWLVCKFLLLCHLGGVVYKQLFAGKTYGIAESVFSVFFVGAGWIYLSQVIQKERHATSERSVSDHLLEHHM